MPFRHGDTGAADAFCLEPHDLVASKLVAGREKDYEYAEALLTTGIVRIDVLRIRVEHTEMAPVNRRRILRFLERTERTLNAHET